MMPSMSSVMILMLLALIWVPVECLFNHQSRQRNAVIPNQRRLLAAEKPEESRISARRRKRRAEGQAEAESSFEKRSLASPPSPNQLPELIAAPLNTPAASTTGGISAAQPDGSNSLEDLFGLGNDQLKELLEQELPVPREDLITGKEVKEEKQDKDKVFKLPDLAEFVRAPTKAEETERKRTEVDASMKIDRSNRDEYLRALQLNPFADADDSLFLEEYDIIPSIFGSGKLLNIPVPYLQTGHGIFLIISLLSAFVYAPGNPLTELPPEIRSFLKTGLAVVYSINVVLSVQAFFIAKGKNLPPAFWAAKTLLLGGVSFYEITEAKDPAMMNEMSVKELERQKKSKRKRN